MTTITELAIPNSARIAGAVTARLR